MAAATGLTAQDAARALAELPRYEEALTAKAFGITLMAFGIAAAAIGPTYALSTPWIVAHERFWLFSFLWMPWIAAAALLTATVWRTQAISLRRAGDTADGRRSWLYTVAFSVLYMVLLGAASLVRARTAWAPSDAVLDLYVLGVFTASLGVFFTWRFRILRLTAPVFGAALLVVAAALVGDIRAADGTPASLGAALVSLVAYVGAGAVVAWRG